MGEMADTCILYIEMYSHTQEAREVGFRSPREVIPLTHSDWNYQYHS